VAAPATPIKPITKAKMTPFLMGVQKGLERADGETTHLQRRGRSL